MKIDKLTKLFAAAVDPVRQNQPTETIKDEARATDASAVRVARDFGTGAANEDESSRRARIEDLKRQVDQGSYRPDSRSVAQAVYRELLV